MSMHDESEMSTSDIHDGEMVRARLEQSALSAAELGRRMGLPDKQIYRLLRTKDWYTDQLAKAGEVLDHDFFAVYHAALERFSPLVHGVLVDPAVLVNEEARKQAVEELRRLLKKN